MQDKQVRCQHKKPANRKPNRVSIGYCGPIKHWTCPYCGLNFKFFTATGNWYPDNKKKEIE